MAMYDSVSNLDQSEKPWKICVRVCRKWKKNGYAKFPLSLEFIMVDHEGAFIHASVKYPFIKLFDELIVENQIYDISHFKVQSVELKNAMCNNPFKILFKEQTCVVQSSFEGFSSSIYNFKSFIDILSAGGNVDSCPFFDVIGHIVCVYKDPGNGVVQFVLQDLEYISLGLLLKPPFSNKERVFVDNGLSGLLNQKVVIIQLCQSTFYEGRVIIYSSGKPTKINFNGGCEFASNYRRRLSHRTYYPEFRFSSPGLHSIPQNVVSLSKLGRANEPMTTWSFGWICDIVNKNNCFLKVCDYCKFKRQDEHGKVICAWCNDVLNTATKYKVIVSVSNGDSTVLLCLLDHIVVEIIGITASECVKDPNQLQHLIGKEFLFRVRISSCHVDRRETIFDVEEFSDNVDLLKLHKDLLQLTKDAPSSSVQPEI